VSIQPATPFYVAPNFENEDGSREAPSEPLVDSIGEMFDLPVFRLSSPSPDQLAILGYLQAQNGATKELIQHARDEGLKFITDTSSKTEEGLYRLLETHIIKPLREQSYIPRRKRRSQKKRVYLDDHGRDALRIFPDPAFE